MKVIKFLKLFVWLIALGCSSQLLANECDSNIDAQFSQNGEVVTALSDKGLSNVVLEFADGSEQKFEINQGDSYSQEFSGTGSNAGKIVVGVWIKSGCEKSGDGPGYGEYISACPVGLMLEVGSDQVTPEPLIKEKLMTFLVSINQPIVTKSCVVAVDYLTADGASGFRPAFAGSDYVAQSGKVLFSIDSARSQPIDVVILVTGSIETTEAFSLNLTDAVNATLGDAKAVGVIEKIEF